MVNGQWPMQKGFGINKKTETKKRNRITKFNVRHSKKSNNEQNSNLRPVNIKFINKPLSNFDLIDRVKKLGFKHFRRIYSRDILPSKIRKACGIFNLDTMIGQGTHWVAFRNINNQAEYFDSFGLLMPKKVETSLNTSNKQIQCFVSILVSILLILIGKAK